MEDGDLLAHLVERFAEPAEGPEIHLVIGPGGAGKSFLFEGLFTYLDEAFQLRKERQEFGVRPVPVMPASLLEAGAARGADLLQAVAATEYGAVSGLGLLTHLVRSGDNILMFDGLDEFFAETEDLAAALEQAFLGDGSRARIVIVLRDTLLETSPAVRGLAERFGARLGAQGFAIYELALWDAAAESARRELAWLKLEGRRPAAGEADTDRVAGFLALLEEAPRLKALGRLAFYCDLLVGVYSELREGSTIMTRGGRPAEDEYDLLELCFEAILDRELAKHRPGDAGAPVRAFLKGDRPASGDPMLAALEATAPAGALDDPNEAVARAFGVIAADDGVLDGAVGDPSTAWARRGLIELIESAAYLSRRRPQEAALTPERLRTLYAAAGFEAGADDQALGQRMLRQFVLFVQSEQTGAVDFAHEFMADFLAARRVVALVKAGAPLAQAVGEPAQGETEVFDGYIRRELG